jgi:hypothetical protein
VPPARPATVEIVDAFDISCVLSGFSGGRTARLVDTASRVILAEATDDTPVFLGASVAPDGTEALISAYSVDGELRATLSNALDDGRCVERTIDLPIVLLLLRSGSSSAEPVEGPSDVIAVLERWYDPLPVFVCGGETRAATETSEWLDPAPWRSPVGFGEPWGFTSKACQSGRTANVDMRVGNTLVDTAAEGYRVLGFLDPTADAED